VSVPESGSTIRPCRPDFSLKDRVAVVTGASRGIGAEIARTFVGAGARVVLAARKADALQQLEVLVVDGGTTMT